MYWFRMETVWNRVCIGLEWRLFGIEYVLVWNGLLVWIQLHSLHKNAYRYIHYMHTILL